jgi:acyl-CoA reductase-like NAD-dependent aldehyde dehydrogenase
MTIGGELVASAETLDVVNPADGAAFAKAPRASQRDLDRAVSAAAAAQRSEPEPAAGVLLILPSVRESR